jgi:diguanylate cyclase (GGDEF)-like protein
MLDLWPLEQMPYLADLPEEAQVWASTHIQAKEFRAGDRIVSQGEPGDGLYLVQRGQVQVLAEGRLSGKPGHIVLATLGPGDVFGELASLDGGPRTATVVALEPVWCWFLPQMEVESVLDRNPLIGRSLMRLLVKRMRRADARVIQEAHDPLTGLANRGVVGSFYKWRAAELARSGGKLAAVLIDVDDMKTINDRGGHDAGDQALVRVAAALQETVRGIDLVARYGGDEFLLLLPGAGAWEADKIIERVRMRLWEGPAISHGVAAVVCRPGEIAPPLQSLVDEADVALYRAKETKHTRQNPSSAKVAST